MHTKTDMNIIVFSFARARIGLVRVHCSLMQIPMVTLQQVSKLGDQIRGRPHLFHDWVWVVGQHQQREQPLLSTQQHVLRYRQRHKG